MSWKAILQRAHLKQLIPAQASYDMKIEIINIINRKNEIELYYKKNIDKLG